MILSQWKQRGIVWKPGTAESWQLRTFNLQLILQLTAGYFGGFCSWQLRLFDSRPLFLRVSWILQFSRRLFWVFAILQLDDCFDPGATWLACIYAGSILELSRWCALAPWQFVKASRLACCSYWGFAPYPTLANTCVFSGMLCFFFSKYCQRRSKLYLVDWSWCLNLFERLCQSVWTCLNCCLRLTLCKWSCWSFWTSDIAMLG